MGAPSDLKLMNTHLHLLEAVTTFYRASNLPLARERLLELINIESNTVVRKNLGACTDKYDPNWTVRLDGGYDRVSYGHDIENIWLLMEACDAAGVSNYPFLDLYKTLFEYSLKYGYDGRNGGFFYTGRFNTPGRRSQQILVGAGRDDRQRAAHVRVHERPQVPGGLRDAPSSSSTPRWWTGPIGEWHESISAQGQAQGNKGSVWKAGYHNGRSMIECIEILKRWGRSPSGNRDLLGFDSPSLSLAFA